jgi:hypothetical protein
MTDTELDSIAEIVRAHRDAGSDYAGTQTSHALVQLADLAVELVEATRALGEIERCPDPSDRLQRAAERRDAAERALARAVRIGGAS